MNLLKLGILAATFNVVLAAVSPRPDLEVLSGLDGPVQPVVTITFVRWPFT
jgi:hypothetical protein